MLRCEGDVREGEPMTSNGRNALGQFVRGNSGGPGRPKGSRNRLGEEFLSDLYVDWMEHGASVIAEVRERNPVAYLRTVAGLLPQQVGITTVREDVRTMTDEELARAMLSAHETKIAEGSALFRAALRGCKRQIKNLCEPI